MKEPKINAIQPSSIIRLKNISTLTQPLNKYPIGTFNHTIIKYLSKIKSKKILQEFEFVTKKESVDNLSNKFVHDEDIKSKPDSLSLSLSPPMTRRREMPALRGLCMSL